MASCHRTPWPAMQTSSNFLHLYSVHLLKEEALPGLSLSAQLRKADVYLAVSVQLDTGTPATCLHGSGRVLLLGLADGSLVGYSWLGKVRGGSFLSIKARISCVGTNLVISQSD